MKPYKQGNLDSLCGLYCVLNTYSVIQGIEESDLVQIFKCLINYLEGEKKLASVLTEGMSFNLLRKLFNLDLTNYQINKKKLKFNKAPMPLKTKAPFIGKSNPSLKEFLDTVRCFIDKSKTGLVLVGLSGSGLKSKNDHWTIIKGITEDSIIMFDSNGMSSIDIKYCNTDDGHKIEFILWPSQCILISNKNSD